MAASVALVLSAPALAQSADASGSSFRRDRNVSVTQRKHPGYQPLGVRLGAFRAWPVLNFTVEQNDNILARQDLERSDTILHFEPGVEIRSDWPRHEAGVYARAAIHRFSEYSEQNTEDGAVGAFGRLDLRRSLRLGGEADWSRLTEDRTTPASPDGSVVPVQFDRTSASLAVEKEFNRLRLSGRARLREFEYDQGRLPSGALLDQSYRDRTVSSLRLRGDYAVSPATALFLEVTGEERDYEQGASPGAADRDASGVEVLAGADFELSSLVRGELAVGHLQYSFDDPRIPDVSGLGVRSHLEWFPTPLLTATFRAARTVEDNAIVQSGSHVESTVSLQADYELRRNLILSARGDWTEYDFRGIDREDERTQFALGATYLLNRHAGLGLEYSRIERSSSGFDAGPQAEVNRLMLRLKLQY